MRNLSFEKSKKLPTKSDQLYFGAGAQNGTGKAERTSKREENSLRVLAKCAYGRLNVIYSLNASSLRTESLF